jgi:heptosyltransferase-2
LGDIVQALPAMSRVCGAAVPGGAALLVGASHAAFAAQTGLFDRVFAFDDEAAYHAGPARRLAVLARAARDARAARPDLCVVFKPAPVYAALASASGARRRVGLTRGGVSTRLLTDAVRIGEFGHWDFRYAALADVALAVSAEAGPPPPRAVPPAVAWRAPAFPAPRPAPDATPGPRIVLAPGGARNAKADLPQKRWPGASFAAVAAALSLRHPGGTFVLLGGPADRADADALLAAAPQLCVDDLVGRTSIPEARAVIASADLFLCNDSALLHVAATTATPTVAVFGPTDPRAICPRVPSVTPVWRPARATACYNDLTGAVAPCAALCCMDRVAPADVLAAAEAALVVPGRGQSPASARSGTTQPRR